jgi:hypothetical protein
MDRGLSAVLAELLNQAREVWRIVQIFRLIVLLLLLLERTSAGKHAEAGPNRLAPGVTSLSVDNGNWALSRKEN